MSLNLVRLSSNATANSHELAQNMYNASNKTIIGNAALIHKSDGTVNSIPKTPAYVFGEHVLLPLINKVSALFSYFSDNLPSLPGAHAADVPTVCPVCPNEALLNAITENDFAGVWTSLQNGANPNSVDEQKGHYLLHTACTVGNPRIVRELLDWGAFHYARTRWGHTPLHTAASKDNTAVIQELIRANAVIDALAEGGITPLCLAVSYGHINSSRLLLDSGASAAGSTLLGRPLENKPLDLAIRGRHYSVVKMLLEYGADASTCNLANAVDQPNMLKLLIDNGANIHQCIPHWDPHFPGNYPIHEAARRGFYDSVNILLRSGADPSVKNHYHRTPLDVARRSLEHYTNSPHPCMERADTKALIQDLKQTIQILS